MRLAAELMIAAWPRADVLTLISLTVAVLATLLALYALHRGNLNSSAASVLSLYGGIQDRWDEYVRSFAPMAEETRGNTVDWASVEARVGEALERLMNILEIAAAIEVEGTFSGVSRLLMRDYLRRMLDAIISDPLTSAKVSDLLQDEDTFYFIRRFIGEKEKLQSVLPQNWYAYPQVSWLDRARSFFRY